MQNPWKISTLVLAGVLVLQQATGTALADQSSLKTALEHLRAAATSLEVGVAGKRAPGDPPSKNDKAGGGSSAQAKALDLTRAAILQVETSLRAR